MIRRPTPDHIAFGWWREALAGKNPIIDETPHPGFYKRKLVKHGPFVPAKIWLDSPVDEAGELVGPETLLAEIDGNYADPADAWPWLCGNPISEAEFNYLEAVRRHVGWHEPDQPQANPRKAIDWTTVNPPQF